MDFEHLAAQLGSGNSTLPEPNTSLIDLGGAIGVKFYNTVVVRYHADGTITANTDGIRKKVTKNRINKYLPDGYSVKKINKKWYLCKPDGTKKEFNDNERLVIESGKNKMKKSITLEEAILTGAKNQFARLCDDLITEQDDPAAAPVGSMPPAQGQEQADLAPAPTAPPEPQPQAGSGDNENAIQELADEIYEIMKREGDVSEGFLQELFREKGYEEKDVSSALDILEKDGRAGKRSTFFVAVEEGDDAEADESGVTPGAVEGDTEEPLDGGEEDLDLGMDDEQNAEVPPPPGGAATQAPPKMGMRNVKNMKLNRMFDTDDAASEEEDIMGDEDEEDEMMSFDDLDGEEEMTGSSSSEEMIDKISTAQDDLRDLVSLVKSIEPQLDDIKAHFAGGSTEIANAMKSLRNKAKNLRTRNPYFNGGGANYPIYGEPTKKTGKR